MGEVEKKRDRLREFLKSRCPDLDIEDDDIKKLVAQGFNEFAIGCASKDDLNKVLPGRLGVVVGLVKKFGEPQLPADGKRPAKGLKILEGPRNSANIIKSDPMKRMIEDSSGLALLSRIDELDSFLKTNPLPSGFPISLQYFVRLAPFDTKNLFKTEDSEYFCKKLDSALAKVLEPPQTGSTEDSFHQFWDDLVNDFLQMFCVEAIFRDRNTSRDLSTGSLRPDVIGQVGMEWALWRGEEKAESTAGDPKKELLDKLTWVYDRVPYIFAYYARGAMVTLVALYMEGTKKMRKLGTFNLGTVDGRVQIILACLNVARLIPCLSSLCEDFSVEAEFKVLSERNGKQVRLYGSSVKKLYLYRAVFDRVVEVYDLIRGCPNSEQVVSSSRKDGADRWHSIVFQPRCRLQRARSESELVKALVCVAKALVWLHERSIMHRDIRWSNIGHHDEAWFLLDFDEACTSPQSEAHMSLSPETHAPETCTGGHDCSVDIWGLGHLIKTSGILGLGPQLIKLQDRCLDRSPSSRPPILYCLNELSSLIRDGLV